MGKLLSSEIGIKHKGLEDRHIANSTYSAVVRVVD
jgi:hypothetical protein